MDQSFFYARKEVMNIESSEKDRCLFGKEKEHKTD